MCGVPRLPEDEALVIHSLLCEDSLLDHGMGTTSMTMIKKVTYAQLRDDDNSICYSTAETCIPPLLGAEEAYIIN